MGLTHLLLTCRLDRGDDEGALSDFDEAVALSGSAKGAYFLQRARARARVAMRSEGREEALAGVQVGLDGLQRGFRNRDRQEHIAGHLT